MTCKKIILVGLQDCKTADRFAHDVFHSLKSEGVTVRVSEWRRRLITPNTEIHFLGQSDYQFLDGIRADAIFGFPEYRRMLVPRLSIYGEIPTVGLVDYVLDIERRNRGFEVNYLGKWKLSDIDDRGIDAIISETISDATTRLAKELDKKIYEEFKKTLMEETNMPTKTATNMYYKFDPLCLSPWITPTYAKPAVDKFEIKAVHFSGPVTAVIWKDGTKTLVRCKDGEIPDPEKGLAMAIAKKALGTNKNRSNYYDIFKKYLPKPEAEPKEESEA